MKPTRRVRSLAAFVSIIALACLLVMSWLPVAKSIKVHIVDVVPASLSNITVAVRTESGETKTFKASDWRLVMNLHMLEPVTIEADDQGNVKSLTGEWQTKLKEILKLK